MKTTIAALALFAAAVAHAQAPGDSMGSACDFSLPRETTPAPDFSTPAWRLVGSGTSEVDKMRYRFYAPVKGDKVTAMVTEGERPERVLGTTIKTMWEAGLPGKRVIVSRRDGAEGKGEPVCVRNVRGMYGLDGLYRAMRCRLTPTPSGCPAKP